MEVGKHKLRMESNELTPGIYLLKTQNGEFENWDKLLKN